MSEYLHVLDFVSRLQVYTSLKNTLPPLQCSLLSSYLTLPTCDSLAQVDGLGVTGVEGLFRRCCESTMRSLRRPDNAAALTTLAEVTTIVCTTVFILEPLFFE
jgi:hypothetical protein